MLIPQYLLSDQIGKLWMRVAAQDNDVGRSVTLHIALPRPISVAHQPTTSHQRTQLATGGKYQ